MNEQSSSDEGFHEAELKVLDRIPTIEVIVPSLGIEQARQIQPKLGIKQVKYFPFTIFTKTSFISYPQFLYHSFDETSVKMERKIEKGEQGELKQLGDFLKTNNFICLYNKFDSKLDYRPDMTSCFRSFEFHNEHKELSGKEFPSKQQIEFSSNFECGNLQFVFGKQNTYYLLLQNDINTKGYNQWFYFQIRNKKKCKVKLVILNISKPVGLLNNAMGISIFSSQQRSFCHKYWMQGGTNIRFYKNGFRRKKNKLGQYYSLEFEYDFRFQCDSVYFALNVPFPYTKMLGTLNEIVKTDNEKIVVAMKQLGRTVSNNSIYVLQFIGVKKTFQKSIRRRSISNQRKNSQALSYQSYQSSQGTKKRQSIIFLGRQHPSETNSSYILQGIMKFLSQESDISLYLIDQYDIYIIPMANPDGVVHGHSRTNLSGYDINRLWNQPNKQKSSQVYCIYNYIQQLSTTTQIKYIFDFHSHSKKLNTFGYFCDNSIETKSFAWYLQYINPNFEYASCTFGHNQSIQKTFRYFAANTIKVKNAITIETSFFGKLEHGLLKKYNTKELYNIGISLLKVIAEFSDEDMIGVMVRNFVKSNVQEVNIEELMSDSDPEEDYLEERERVKIILSARREQQSKLPKSKTQKSTNSRRLSTLKSTNQRQNSKTTSFTTKIYRPPQQFFKPYSQQLMLKDDESFEQLPQTRIQTEPTQYHWNYQRLTKSGMIFYPTSLNYCNPEEAKALVKRRRYKEQSSLDLERLILQSRKRQRQKYQYISYEEKRKKFSFKGWENKKLLEHTLTVSSFKDFGVM